MESDSILTGTLATSTKATDVGCATGRPCPTVPISPWLWAILPARPGPAASPSRHPPRLVPPSAAQAPGQFDEPLDVSPLAGKLVVRPVAIMDGDGVACRRVPGFEAVVVVLQQLLQMGRGHQLRRLEMDCDLAFLLPGRRFCEPLAVQLLPVFGEDLRRPQQEVYRLIGDGVRIGKRLQQPLVANLKGVQLRIEVEGHTAPCARQLHQLPVMRPRQVLLQQALHPRIHKRALPLPVSTTKPILV